jgi:hypothetical protein
MTELEKREVRNPLPEELGHASRSSWALLDLTVYGRQEAWEDSPDGWPQRWGENRVHGEILTG